MPIPGLPPDGFRGSPASLPPLPTGLNPRPRVPRQQLARGRPDITGAAALCGAPSFYISPLPSLSPSFLPLVK